MSGDLFTASISLKGVKGKGAVMAWKFRPTLGQSRVEEWEVCLQKKEVCLQFKGKLSNSRGSLIKEWEPCTHITQGIQRSNWKNWVS